MEEEDMFEELGQILAKALPKEPTETMKLYMKLGQSITDIRRVNALSIVKAEVPCRCPRIWNKRAECSI
jgi:hypothetical protein